MQPTAPLALLALTLAVAAPVQAGQLFRCDGADGVRSYTSARVKGAKCTVVASYKASARSAPASGRVPPPAAAGSAKAASAGRVASSPPPARPASNMRVDFRTAPAGAALAAAPATGGARVTRGAIYRYERNGVTHYTNVPPPGGSGAKVLFTYVETCFACGVLPGVNFGTVRLNTEAYAAEIRAAALEYGVEEAVVRAIIHAESAYRANALSHKGAQGLMQLMPGTASDLGVSDPFDPLQNIRGGVSYLATMLGRYGQDLKLAAAAYNAGPGAVDRFGGVPPYAETQRYVERVGQLADRYRGALAAR